MTNKLDSHKFLLSGPVPRDPQEPPVMAFLRALSAPTLGVGSLTIELGIESPLPCGLYIPLDCRRV